MDTDSMKWLKLKSGCDIRGTEQQLTAEAVEKLGYAFACLLARKLDTTPDKLTVAVGRDARPSGRRIQAALVRGVTAADSDVLDGGACAAPALFSRAARCDTPAGAIMVTGGDESARTGFKLYAPVCGFGDADVTELLRMAADVEVPERLVTRENPMDEYRESLRRIAAVHLQDDALRPLLGLKAAVRTDGVGGAFFAGFLEELGVEVERVDADAALEAVVPACGADLGVALDADCCRAAIFDETGAPVAQNRLIALLAAMLLEKHPGATLVTDSVTSSGLSAFIAEWGGVHYRFKRGYRNVIDEAIRLNEEGIDCPLAIETTGLAAFRENSFLDDGIYLALRIVCEALDRKREGQTVFSLLEGLEEPVETASLRLSVLDEDDPAAACQEAVEIILSHTLDNPEWQLAPDNREGIRITFNLDGGVNNAWFQLRISVHAPTLPLDVASDVPGGVRRILSQLYALLGQTRLLDLTPLKRLLDGEAQN